MKSRFNECLTTHLGYHTHLGTIEIPLDLAPSNQLNFFSAGVSQAVEELDRILAFNNLLVSFKNHPDVDRFARGVGPISLVGKLLGYLFI